MRAEHSEALVAGRRRWLARLYAAGGKLRRGPRRSPAECRAKQELRWRRLELIGRRRKRRNEKADHKRRLARIAAGLPAYTDDEFNTPWPSGAHAKGGFGS